MEERNTGIKIKNLFEREKHMISLTISNRRDCPFYLAQSGFCKSPKGPDLCILGNEPELPLDCPLRNENIIISWQSLKKGQNT
jgi:hypothetical protein